MSEKVVAISAKASLSTSAKASNLSARVGFLFVLRRSSSQICAESDKETHMVASIRLILFMGKSGKKIVDETLNEWNFDFQKKESVTNKDSFLINIKNIKKINKN